MAIPPNRAVRLPVTERGRGPGVDTSAYRLMHCFLVQASRRHGHAEQDDLRGVADMGTDAIDGRSSTVA